MNKRPIIAVVAGSGTIGGTQKAAALFAAGLARRGYPVHYLCSEPGLWSRHAAEGGVHVASAAMTARDIGGFLASVRPDILHQHVSGMALDNPVYPALAGLPPDQRPSLIETNVFGRFEDPEGDRWVQRHMFVSRTSCIQAFHRARRPITPETLRHTTILTNPVLPAVPASAAERVSLRTDLDVAADEVLAVRIGRPPDCKWADWECRAFATAHRHNPRLRLLLMEPPRALWASITAGKFGPGILARPATDDQAWLNRLYAAADLTVHASYFGESFGYTIAEAMAAGLPVITLTTPFGDNAQVELVENGVTGWVCGTAAEMGRRWMELAAAPAQRDTMGSAGRARIRALANLDDGLDVLEAVIAETLTAVPQPHLQAIADDLLRFAADFPAREWRLSESTDSHPFDHAVGRCYTAYRRMRTRARKTLTALTQRARLLARRAS